MKFHEFSNGLYKSNHLNLGQIRGPWAGFSKEGSQVKWCLLGSVGKDKQELPGKSVERNLKTVPPWH